MKKLLGEIEIKQVWILYKYNPKLLSLEITLYITDEQYKFVFYVEKNNYVVAKLIKNIKIL